MRKIIRDRYNMCRGMQLLSVALCICMFISSTLSVFATEHNSVVVEEKHILMSEGRISAGAVVGPSTVRTANEVVSQYKFHTLQGHAFAAEQANNFIDTIKGKNTIVVGDNNVKNGPDRIIINRDNSMILIQDKYYSTAQSSISACFDEKGIFRYIDADGNPMQIEVPKDQYDDAILAMQEKIKQGKIPGYEDPSKASELVRKGNITYKQAKNLAKAGTIESLTYDAVHGTIVGGVTFGISTLVNYAVLRVNGNSREESIKKSAIEGVKAGAGVFCTAVIAGQLGKTGILNLFKPSSEALTKALGKDFSEALLKVYGQQVVVSTGRESVASTATQQAAKLLRSQALVAVVTTLVFSAPDAVDVFRGRISKTQFVKNFAVTAVSVVAGTVGYGVGGFVGNLVVPGVGTVPGGVVGSIVLGAAGGFITDKIADYITDDDSEKMYAILEEEFSVLCEDYLANEEEAKMVASKFSEMLNDNMFKDMYQSKDREKYAQKTLEPLFEEMAVSRVKITAPTEEEMRASLKEQMKGVVFIH